MTSKMELFPKKKLTTQTVNYFRIKQYLRYLTGFLIRFWSLQIKKNKERRSITVQNIASSLRHYSGIQLVLLRVFSVVYINNMWWFVQFSTMCTI